MRIAIVIPYFGKWPSYFNFFLKGCEANQWLDIIFFTNCAVPEHHPANVYFNVSSLKEIACLASKKLGFELEIRTPYKLCDLKPFYGLVFEDYLTNYQFWGYGDIDLIYGNLKSFVMPRIEAGFDILSSRQEIVSGSFAVLRNTDYINKLGKRMPDYITLLRSNRYEALDETAHSNVTWQGKSRLELPENCFTKVVAQAAFENKVKASFTTICKEHIDFQETIHYDYPVLTFENETIGYYHYVINKNKPGFKIPKWEQIPDHFVVTYSGFYTLNELTYFQLLSGYRRVTGHSKSLLSRIYNKLIRESNRILHRN